MFLMAGTLSGSGFSPSLDITWPINQPFACGSLTLESLSCLACSSDWATYFGLDPGGFLCQFHHTQPQGNHLWQFCKAFL